MGCLFCNIVAKTTPAQIVFENDHVVAFRDIRPVAPTHALVIPKKHIVGAHEATGDDAATLGQVLLAARDVAEKLGLASGGYRLVINQGPDAGQSVFHLHCHVIGGRQMGWPPFPPG
jgi:histidine triad (HIT) family protein